jgi:hypothetical protein
LLVALCQGICSLITSYFCMRGPFKDKFEQALRDLGIPVGIINASGASHGGPGS